MQKNEKTQIAFLTSVKEEFKKISWTEREELLHCTKIVLVTTFFLGMSIYIVDLISKGVLNSLAQVAKAIF